jgi:F5/8 type C domain
LRIRLFSGEGFEMRSMRGFYFRVCSMTSLVVLGSVAGCGSNGSISGTTTSGGGGANAGRAGTSALAGRGGQAGNAGAASHAQGGTAAVAGGAGSSGSGGGPPEALGTLLDEPGLVADLPDAQWYLDNIPFLDIPDASIQEVYYYRFSTLYRARQYTTPSTGYVFTEFVEPPGYASAFGAIDAAAGHHLYEARWLKTARYAEDYLRFWLEGPGKSGAHQYSFWVADATYARYLVDGDESAATALLSDLTAQYDGWSDHFDSTHGLYWQTPVWDAMEYTIGSYQTSDPYHGGDGFRPSINAYQFGDAQAISRIAALAGNLSVQSDYAARAASLKANTQKELWDPARNFFFHEMIRNSAQAYAEPEGTLLDGREEIGFVPWYFDLPDASYSSAWSSLLDKNAFFADYGPTTAERRHRLFMNEALSGCCRWDGMSWPYATSQTLTALANLLNDYEQTTITSADYYTLLAGFAKSQHKNGKPYVAEALHPDTGEWLYDSPNHSEHYNHSSFDDLVITGLIGLRPQAGDRVVVNPLVPSDWSYFALQDVAYHGHLLTIVWDRDGSHYGKGAGLAVYQDGLLLRRNGTLARLDLAIAAAVPPKATPRLSNYACNATGADYPKATASYSNAGDDPSKAIDGKILYDDIPNSRWTNYQSPNAEDWLALDFGSPRSVSEFTLHIYDDGGGVQAPISYTVEYLSGANWLPVSRAKQTPVTPTGRAANVVDFDAVSASQFRVRFQKQPNAWVGITELEAWANP